MNLPFKTRFRLLVGFQLILLLGLMAYKQVTLVTGERVLLETVPVDPRDLFRGDYVTLRYRISRLDRSLWKEPAFQKGETICVSLQRRGRFWEAESVSHTRPEDGRLFLRGTVTSVTDDALRAQYGIESYFVPEGEGGKWERAAGKGLSVEAAIDRFGHAAIRQLKIEHPNEDIR